MPTFKLYIPDIVCINCVEPIKNALSECKGVTSVKVDTLRKIATVTTSDTETSDPNIKQILYDTVDAIGFPATDDFNETTSISEQIVSDTKTQKAQISSKKMIRTHWIKGIIGILSGTAMMAICLWGMGIPLIAMGIIGGMSSLLTLYLGKDTYKHAVTQLVKTKTLSMESLFTVSTLIALGVSCASLWMPWLPMMFDAGLFILGFKSIGTAIKESAKQRVNKMSFRDYAPKKIELEESENQYKSCLVKDLVPENIIIVRSGQTVPTNAICLSEHALLYNTRITGRTIPESFNVGETIYAGSVVPKDIPFIRMKVSAKESESYLVQLDQESEQAESQKAPIEISTNKMLRYFIRAVFGIAIFSAVLASILISPLAALQCGIAVLAAACPCTLGLIIPLAIKTGIAKAAEQGVNFKSGKSIQAAAEVDTVVLDLNGTLTTGIPMVVKSTVPSEMLSHLAAIEKHSDHPIAKAIFNFAKGNQTEFKNITVDKSNHAGLSAQIDNENFVIGNANMIKKMGIDTTSYEKELKSTTAEHIIYFVRDKKIIGTLLLTDPLRDDAKQTIQELKKLGKNIYLCTGSDPQTAEKYADELGIPQDNIKANCLSKTKTAYIQALSQAGHKVAMIGDAANDATPVAVSHFGIAIKSAASDRITQQNAGATINKSSLWSVIHTFNIANQTVANIKQNLAATISYNLLSMIAFGGLLVGLGFAVNPAIGALLMVVQIGLVLLNLERFKRQSIPALKINSPEFKGGTHAQLTSKLAPKAPQPQIQPSIIPRKKNDSIHASHHLRTLNLVGQHSLIQRSHDEQKHEVSTRVEVFF